MLWLQSGTNLEISAVRGEERFIISSLSKPA